jgi:hypothetical protein
MDDTFSGFTFKISTEGNVAVTKSLAGAVIAGRNIEMTNSNTQAAVAGAGTNLYNSRAKIAVTGNTLKLGNSSAGIIKAGRDVEVRDSHIRMLASSQVTAHGSRIGVVLSRQTILAEGSQVTINTPQAAVIGSAFGAAFAVVHWLLKRYN